MKKAARLPASEPTISLAPEQLFNLLSDQTRLRCLALMQQEKEICVCEITYALKMIQPKISRHLALLRKFNLVTDHRKGLWIYYCLHPHLPQWMQKTINKTFDAIRLVEPYASDRARLINMPNRPTTCVTTVKSAKRASACCPQKT